MMPAAQILIIDDDPQICDMFCRHLRHLGYTAAFALTLTAGMDRLAAGTFDVVFLDVRLPDGDGLSAISKIRKMPASPEIIIFTAAGDPNGAELAINSGAWDYLEKPLRIKELILPLTRALQYRQAKAGPRSKDAFRRNNITGSSPAIRRCLDLAAEAASSEESVLITGQTGTGKELFARAIHDNSHRSAGPFVALDCASIADSLAGSTLFGHQKGAFTGANRLHTGVIKQADGGTLFLDEVGELSGQVQISLLRVLQEHRFRSLGADKELSSDFRLLSATNRDLTRMVATGRFREDLYFRLTSLEIALPPLRDRTDDALEMALRFLRELSKKYRKCAKGMSPEFYEALLSYSWPGNVRELHGALERAVVSSGNEPVLFPNHLPTHIRIKLARSSIGRDYRHGNRAKPAGPVPATLPPLSIYRQTIVRDAEKQYLRQLMSVTRGDIRKACGVSGLSQSRMYHLLKIHKLDRRKNH